MISMSNSSDSAIANQSFDNVFYFHTCHLFIPKTTSIHHIWYVDSAPCCAVLSRRSVSISEERSCLGGAVLFRRSSRVWKEIRRFRRLSDGVGATVLFRRRSDFDYLFNKHMFVQCLSISHRREVVLGGVRAEAKPVSSFRIGDQSVARSAYRCVRTYDSHSDPPPPFPSFSSPSFLSSCRRRVVIGIQSEIDIRDFYFSAAVMP